MPNLNRINSASICALGITGMRACKALEISGFVRSVALQTTITGTLNISCPVTDMESQL